MDKNVVYLDDYSCRCAMQPKRPETLQALHTLIALQEKLLEQLDTLTGMFRQDPRFNGVPSDILQTREATRAALSRLRSAALG